jgi:HAD superfamily hydrolase (TIGR01509 family)
MESRFSETRCDISINEVSRALLSSLSPLEAVIFDCDGVLVDTEPIHYQAFQHILAPLGLGYGYDAYVERYIGYDDREAFLEVFREAGRSIDANELSKLIQAKSEALEQIVAKGISTFPGLVSLVRELLAYQAPLAVASGSLRHEICLYLRFLGFEDAFPVIVAADDVRQSKPDPETYILALERLKQTPGFVDLNPQRCAAIEDTPAGIESARGAGLFVVGVTHSVPASELSKADIVVDSLTQLNVSKLMELIASSRI